MMDYSEQLADIIELLEGLQQSFSTFYSGYVPYNGLSYSDALDAILAAMPSSPTVANDYSDVMQNLCELMAYQNMMLLVLTVVIVIGIGIYTGFQITKWLRSR